MKRAPAATIWTFIFSSGVLQAFILITQHCKNKGYWTHPGVYP